MDSMELTSTYWHSGFVLHFCAVNLFSNGTQPFDFIKPNVIGKLALKVKCNSQVNGGLIMFFGNLRIRFLKLVFKISWLDCEHYGKNQIDS